MASRCARKAGAIRTHDASYDGARAAVVHQVLLHDLLGRRNAHRLVRLLCGLHCHWRRRLRPGGRWFGVHRRRRRRLWRCSVIGRHRAGTAWRGASGRCSYGVAAPVRALGAARARFGKRPVPCTGWKVETGANVAPRSSLTYGASYAAGRRPVSAPVGAAASAAAAGLRATAGSWPRCSVGGGTSRRRLRRRPARVARQGRRPRRQRRVGGRALCAAAGQRGGGVGVSPPAACSACSRRRRRRHAGRLRGRLAAAPPAQGGQAAEARAAPGAPLGARATHSGQR